MKMEMRRRAIDKLYKRRDRIDMPDFQREEVWNDHQKRQLIDTVSRPADSQPSLLDGPSERDRVSFSHDLSSESIR